MLRKKNYHLKSITFWKRGKEAINAWKSCVIGKLRTLVSQWDSRICTAHEVWTLINSYLLSVKFNPPFKNLKFEHSLREKLLFTMETVQPLKLSDCGRWVFDCWQTWDATAEEELHRLFSFLIDYSSSPTLRKGDEAAAILLTSAHC